MKTMNKPGKEGRRNKLNLSTVKIRREKSCYCNKDHNLLLFHFSSTDSNPTQKIPRFDGNPQVIMASFSRN